jgi:molybdopterin-guanine dinucleotide biosynthesis protein A
MIDRTHITGVVLAGGQGRRMGGADKGLLLFRGQPLVCHGLAALDEVAGHVLINANRHLDRYRQFGHRVITDSTDGYEGPLAGLLSALGSATTPYTLTIPCDTPLMTGPMLQRLAVALAASDAELAVADDGVRLHPVFLLAKTRVAGALERYLETGQRKVQAFIASQPVIRVDYSDRPELFTNINTPHDLLALEHAAANSDRP